MAVIDVFRVAAQVGPQASRVNNFTYNNAGEQALAKENANTVNALVKGGEKLYDTMVTADVMKANYEINQKVQELQNILYQNKEENAQKNMELFKEGRQKIMDEYMKNASWTLGDPRAQAALTRSLDKDWLSQSNQMQRYVLGEQEKALNTQTENQMRMTIDNGISNWADTNLVADLANRGDGYVRARFAQYGAEKQKQAAEQWRGNFYATMAQAAMNGNNYDLAGVYLQGNGKYMEPKVRMQLEKVISERRKNNQSIVSAQDLFKVHGEDVEGAVKAWNASKLNNNKAAGMDFIRGEIGKQYGENDCANRMSEYISKAGGDQRLISPVSDGMLLKAEQAGLAFNDRGQLRDGDLVFWNREGSGWVASDDPNAVTSDDNRIYKGADHVGVYNAKTGKVIQSGTHGVTEMDIDAPGYKPVGFAHIGSAYEDPTEAYKNEQEFRKNYGVLVQRQKTQENYQSKMFEDEVLQMLNNNVSLEDALKTGDKLAGTDGKIWETNRATVNRMYKLHGKDGTGSNSKGLELEQAEKLISMMKNGRFEDNRNLFAETAVKLGASKDDYKMLMKAWDQYEEGEGEYSYNFTPMKKAVMDDSKLEDSAAEMAWLQAQAYAREKIKEYMKTHEGHMPKSGSPEVLGYLREGLTYVYIGELKKGNPFGIGDKKYRVSKGKLASMGIKSWRLTSNGLYDLYMGNGHHLSMTEEEFRNRVGAEEE